MGTAHTGQLEARGTDLGDGSGCGSFLQTEEQRVSSYSCGSPMAHTVAQESGPPLAPSRIPLVSNLTPSFMSTGWVVCNGIWHREPSTSPLDEELPGPGARLRGRMGLPREL